LNTARKFGLAKFDICGSPPVSKVILQHAKLRMVKLTVLRYRSAHPPVSAYQ